MHKYIPFLLGLLFFSSCYNEYAQYSNKPTDYATIPQVQSLEPMDGLFVWSDQVKMDASADLKEEGDRLSAMLKKQYGVAIGQRPGGQVQMRVEADSSNQESYTLDIYPDKILLVGASERAVFWGLQTLMQLTRKDMSLDGAIVVPSGRIVDEPVYGYRGMHLDVCRHFFSVDFIKRYLDVMALHKMNTFHWHLTEDQGWRIEIKMYPELTNVGAWRNGTIVGHYPGERNDEERYGGYYTQEEIKEVVAYAADRHITVIPEIELPGHSSAAIAAYPSLSCFPSEPTQVNNGMMSEASVALQAAGQEKIVQETWGVFDDVYCAGKEGTFSFVENVLTEVMDLFPAELIHIGGDECPKGNWKRCHYCQKRIQDEGLKDEHELQSYFITRVEQFVNSKGKQIIGWDEILEGGLAPNASVMSWRGTQGGIEAAEQGHAVVMSPTSNCYFDYYQSEDRTNEPLAIGGFLPVEKVYAFDPMPESLAADKKDYILGGQANLWTEYIGTEEEAWYMLLPRMTAISEALWTNIGQKDYEDFKIRLQDVRADYDRLGYNYAPHVFED